MGMEDFPEDVMRDVLSRLDYKTVSCCQCVCKRWRGLVLDPYFNNNLLWSNKMNPSLMIHDTTFHHRGRLKWIEIQDKVVEVEKKQPVDVVTIHDVDLSNLGLLGLLGHPCIECNFYVNIGRSANGLICMRGNYNNTYIVNPIAKQYLALPNPHSTTLISLGYGFGSLDDATYKVINVFIRCLPHAITQIEVSTLGTDNRRVLQPNNHFNIIGAYIGSGLFFNGRVHWINNGGHQLFVFDLDSETFNLFPSPPFEGEENEQKYRGILGLLKGCLSEGCLYFCDIFTVWVMKQHGIKDSWYKAFTIKETRITRKLYRPLCLIDGLKGGYIFAKAGDKLVAYCLQTNTHRTINLTSSTSNPRSVNIVSVSSYHPTFVNLQNFATPNTLVQTL